MVFHGSRMVFHGSRLVFHGFRLVFHGSRLVLWFFMVPGWFSWFFMVSGCILARRSSLGPPLGGWHRTSFNKKKLKNQHSAQNSFSNLIYGVGFNVFQSMSPQPTPTFCFCQFQIFFLFFFISSYYVREKPSRNSLRLCS